MALNERLDKKQIEEVVRESLDSPFNDLIGIKLLEIDRGRVVLELKGGKELANGIGIMHGGVTATLCDVAMGISVGSLGFTPMTVEMKINYISPGPIDGVITAVGRVIKAGRTLFITESEVYKGDKILAKSLGTYSGRKPDDLGSLIFKK